MTTNTTSAPTLDLQTETAKLINKVETMSLESLLEQWIIPYGTKILISLAIYFVGRFLARFLSNLISKAVFLSSKDEILASFIRSISYFLLLLISVIFALSELGINTSSLVALIGAAGLAIGLALQNSLQNFAAGVMILIFKPFKKGDFIEAGGTSGKVEQMGLLMLELRSGDNKTILVPNGKVFSDCITNYSRNKVRRIDLIFDIAYEADIQQAKEIINQCLANDKRVLQSPQPLVAVGNLAASSVQLFVRPWVRTGDYSDVQYALMEQVKIAFDKANIAIPFNQLDIHFPENSEIAVK